METEVQESSRSITNVTVIKWQSQGEATAGGGGLTLNPLGLLLHPNGSIHKKTLKKDSGGSSFWVRTQGKGSVFQLNSRAKASRIWGSSVPNNARVLKGTTCKTGPPGESQPDLASAAA